MKVIFKTLLFLLTVVILFQCRKESVEKEPEPEVTFPDKNFFNALIELGVDTDGDSIISPAEAEVITVLDVSKESISDMTGIEKFVNLEYLMCGWNLITSLDVSNNTVLAFLSCEEDQLTSLDISNNPALKNLFCRWNQLTTLDVSNHNLKSLYCGSNEIANLDVSNSTGLIRLDCDLSHLTSLDISNNTAIEYLSCFGNQIITLDISNNTALTKIYIREMPTLTKVCVWEMPFPPTGVEVDIIGSPNVYFTTDCN